MKKFEYEILPFSSYDDIEEALNERGKLGWELVSVNTVHKEIDKTWYELDTGDPIYISSETFAILKHEIQE